MKPIKKFNSSFAVNIIGSVVMLLLVFGILVSAVGYISFTDAFKHEYSTTTYHMADTATLLIKADEIDSYLENGGESESYKQTKRYLDNYCLKMDVSIIYVIKVDTSDYGRFTSVFNSLGKDSPYTEWEIGYQRDATNEEYVQNYRDLYEGRIDCGTIYRTTNLNGAPPHITTLVPVKNTAGEVVSLLCVQRPMDELTESRRPYLITIAFTTVFLMILTSFVAALYIRRQFVAPIRKVIGEAQRFAAENKAGEKLGDGISRIEDIADLAASIDMMEEEMLEYIENLTSVTAEKERIGTELSLAAAIQSNSLPNQFPAFPERSDFDIYASMTPAKEVGGDFYDFFLLDDDHLAITIADVSGKGIPAALFMMVTNILINNRAHMGGTPAEILSFVNDRICEHNQAEMFVTVWLGILELSTGRLTAANAGHEDPAVKRRDGDFELIKTKHGLVIGAMEGIRYKDVEIRLNRGDKLFLYTDGIPEATDEVNHMFTLAEMLMTLNYHKNESPQQIIEGVRHAVSAFVGDAPQFDDLTAVCLELKDTSDTVTSRLVTDATDDNLDKVNDFIDGFLTDSGCSAKTLMKIRLAVEECYVNIAHYAYGNKVGQAEIILEKNHDTVTIIFKDRGKPYNPLAKDDPDITLSADERPIGGLGIFLVKKNMDDVSYKFEDNCNMLILTKNIG